MKLANAIEGGLAGASTLTLLQEALHKIDGRSPRPMLHRSGLIKKLKKGKYKTGFKSTKLYIQLAGELLANAAYFGLAGLGKKKNAVLRGGLLGLAAGLGSAFMVNDKSERHNNHQGNPAIQKDELRSKLLTIGLYTAGGILAGAAVKKLNVKNKKKKK